MKEPNCKIKVYTVKARYMVVGRVLRKSLVLVTRYGYYTHVHVEKYFYVKIFIHCIIQKQYFEKLWLRKLSKLR